MGEYMPSYALVFMTTSTKEEATKIVRCLLEEKLVACANTLGPINSLFWWKGKIDESNEFLTLMKSHSRLFSKISKRVREMHSYEVPELIALSIEKGLPTYLSWIDTTLQAGE